MPMDITPLIPEGKLVIDGYGNGGFTVNATRYEHSLILMPHVLQALDITDMDALTREHLTPIVEASNPVEILLIGCGKKMEFLPPELEQFLRSHDIVADVMDTGAACRTYNVLLSEERRMAAVLIGV